jgi:DNA polymerase-3 subunit delta
VRPSTGGEGRGGASSYAVFRRPRHRADCSRLYLYGDEPKLQDEVLTAIRGALFGQGGGAEAFNVDRIDAETASPAEIVDAANQLPVLAPRRLVVVRGAERLLRAEADAGEEGALARYLEHPSPQTCLVLLGEKPDGRLRLAKEIAGGMTVELTVPRTTLAAWAPG